MDIEKIEHQWRRRLNAQRAALLLHAGRDSTDLTENARRTFLARFEHAVDPDGILPRSERLKRAERALRAHMIGLSLKSAQARSAAGPKSSVGALAKNNAAIGLGPTAAVEVSDVSATDLHK